MSFTCGLPRFANTCPLTYVDDAAPVLIVLAPARPEVVTRPIVRSDERSVAVMTIVSGCDVPATTATSVSEAGWKPPPSTEML
jgi:hypothetical protein